MGKLSQDNEKSKIHTQETSRILFNILFIQINAHLPTEFHLTRGLFILLGKETDLS